MKNGFLLFSVLVFMAFSVTAQVTSADADKNEAAAKKEAAIKKQESINQDTPNQAQANNPNAPVIDFNKLVHDYGDVEQHGDGRCEFEFTNNGKEPLILSNVRSSCGCTVPEWPRQPILPGQSDVIKVKYDTKRVGTINKTVHVYSNAATSPITLRITGKVIAQSATNLPEKNTDKDGSPVNK